MRSSVQNIVIQSSTVKFFFSLLFFLFLFFLFVIFYRNFQGENFDYILTVCVILKMT
jgi:quinol-cytochrome oxidoreductase complex cytochrome b subunit